MFLDILYGLCCCCLFCFLLLSFSCFSSAFLFVVFYFCEFDRLSQFVKRFFVAFGSIALMASSGVESFLAKYLAVVQEVVERVPAGKFDFGVASRVPQVICWNRVS